MRESVRKLGLIGVGLWAMTEEKIDEMVKDLVDKGTISKEEGKKAIQDVQWSLPRRRNLHSTLGEPPSIEDWLARSRH